MGKRLPTALSQDQLDQLLEQPNITTTIGLRDRVMMETMARAGLRVSEVVALRRQDITWGSGEQLTMIHVRQGKGAKDRNVPVTDQTARWLRMWDQERHGYASTFFHTCAARSGGAVRSSKHSGLSTRTVQEMVKRHAGEAGLSTTGDRRVTPHVLRHTFATWQIDKGTPTAVVQSMLGHERIETTEIYLDVSDPQVMEAMRRISRAEDDQQSLDTQPSTFAAAVAGAIDGLPEAQKRELAEQLGLTG